MEFVASCFPLRSGKETAGVIDPTYSRKMKNDGYDVMSITTMSVERPRRGKAGKRKGKM
jgi:hypothetical protein